MTELQKNILNRFLRYVQIDTMSEEGRHQTPSTEKQFDLAYLLKEELSELGLKDITVDEHGFVYATLPSNQQNCPLSIGLIAHMDTIPGFSGKNVRPQVIENYDGKDIVLSSITLSPTQFPRLMQLKGKTLITTDGTTVLGADDKAGIANIMAMLSYLAANPMVPHAEIHVAFTPDEEIGEGIDYFDLNRFPCDFAYTVDGGLYNEINYENFNAASCQVSVKGLDIHPGDAKNQMKNATEIAMEFHQLLPENEKPQYTEKYEGFFHLTDMKGTVGEARLDYIIRDHDPNQMIRKKQILADIQHFLCRKYNDPNLIHLHIQDSYSNMKALIDRDPRSVIRAEKAMEKLKITALSTPIRGGTDGARLTVRGLNTPNLGTGGYNCHGPYEFACLEEMETVVRILIEIVRL